MKQRKVAIVGGSLTGPATARFLYRNGIRDVTIYEALRRTHSQSGGVMGLRQDTMSALESIGVSRADVAALGSEAVVSHDVTTGGRIVYRGQTTHPGVTTSWDRIYQALSSDAPVQFGKRVARIDPDGRRYVLTFVDGSQDTADRVIFADGRKSLGRDLLDARPLRYNGYVVWRGLAAPTRDVARMQGFHRYYDPTGQRLFSVTAPLLHNGRSYWELSHNLSAADYASLARGRGPTDNAYLLPGTITDEARQVIARAADRLPRGFRTMIAGSEVSGIPVNDVEMPSRAAFVTDRGAAAMLLGDALIPVRLQVGAGLNQAIAQAHELAQALTADDTVTALKRWQTSVLRRLGPIVELGRMRAHRINLGAYIPVRAGMTATPDDGTAFGLPKWVTA